MKDSLKEEKAIIFLVPSKVYTFFVKELKEKERRDENQF